MKKTERQLRGLAKKIDKHFGNAPPGSGGYKPVGWVLLTFGFNAPSIGNYLSNTVDRENMIELLRETADRLERNEDNRRV